MTQGKTDKQIKDSKNLVKLGYSGIIILVIIMVMVNWTESLPSHHSEYGPPHNYWVPITSDTLDSTDLLELKEPDAIYYDTPYNMLDMHMDDYNYCDTIYRRRYSSFTDVPAGTDTIIIVDDILYKINDNKTKWIPVYPDEYIMWIGSNGDTIWE